MRVFAIADLHLSLGVAEDKSMDMFGGSWVEHDKRLKTIWERLVEPEDLVIIPGDISWGLSLQEAIPDLAFIDALPGTKLILKGNHDLWWASMKKMRGLFESIHFIQHDCYSGPGFVIYGTRGWICPSAKDFSEEDAAIYRRETLRLKMSAELAQKAIDAQIAERGERPVLIGVMHYPPTNENHENSDFTDIFSQMGTNQVLYGHLHGFNAFKNGPSGLIDGVEYKLVSLDKLECAPLPVLEV